MYGGGMPGNVRETLWSNLQTLMQRHWGRENLSRLGALAGTGSGTPGRLKLRQQSIGIDVLAKFAEAMGVEAWQLLAPALGETMSQAALTIARRFDALPDDKTRLKAYTLIDRALGQALLDESIPGPPLEPTPTAEPAGRERTTPATAPARSGPQRSPVKDPPTRVGR
jgi:hypothetical protein